MSFISSLVVHITRLGRRGYRKAKVDFIRGKMRISAESCSRKNKKTNEALFVSSAVRAADRMNGSSMIGS